MPRRQQRSPNWRGQVQPPNRYTRNVIPIRVEVPDQFTVHLIAPAAVTDLQVIGQCGLIVTETGYTVATTNVAGNVVGLTLAGFVEPGQHLRLLAGDPGVRSAAGGFLSPIDFEVPSVPYPPPPLQRFSWDVASFAANSCTCQMSGSDLIYASNVNVWKASNQAGFTTAHLLTANTWAMDFAEDLESGVFIEYVSDSIDLLDNLGQIPEGGLHPIP